VRNLEALAGDHIHVIAFQLLPRCKTDRVDEDVIVVPVFAQLGENILDVLI